MQYFVDSLKKEWFVIDLKFKYNWACCSLSGNSALSGKGEENYFSNYLLTILQQRERERETETEWASTMKVSTTHLVTGMMDAMV